MGLQPRSWEYAGSRRPLRVVDMAAFDLGRPVCINLNDSDIEMITEEDFIEDEVGHPAEYKLDPIHVAFFLPYVKLMEITCLVLEERKTSEHHQPNTQ